MHSQSRTSVLTSDTATANVAVALAPRLKAGDVVLLSGDIGAGKTHFARSLIQHLLPEPEDVPSPTFTLVQVYETGDFEIWHADLYRLTDPDQCIELGLTDAFSNAVCLVEWPDRLGDLTPKDALHLTFSYHQMPDNQRLLTANWTDPKWADRLQGVIQ